VRALAVGIAKAWMDQQFPGEKKSEKSEAGSKGGKKDKDQKLAAV
jgi:hypothetical protein